MYTNYFELLPLHVQMPVVEVTDFSRECLAFRKTFVFYKQAPQSTNNRNFIVWLEHSLVCIAKTLLLSSPRSN